MSDLRVYSLLWCLSLLACHRSQSAASDESIPRPATLPSATTAATGDPPTGLLSVVSIRGDHLAEVGEVLKKGDYVISRSFDVSTGEQAVRELDWNPDRNHVAKLAYVESGWTHIVDPELVLPVDDWTEYSAKWKTRIVAFSCEPTSESCALSVFESGRKRREVLATSGEVSTNRGAPLAEEQGLDWTRATDEEVVETARRLGADYDYLAANRKYVVFQLDESQIKPNGH